MNIIIIKNLIKNYGKKRVLFIDELTVKKGEICALIGLNGAGKSTLLRIAGLLESFDSGELKILDNIIKPGNDNLQLRRRMATVFQTPFMYRMSVRENISLPLKFRGIPEKIIKEKVNLWMDRLSIKHLAEASGNILSGGEKSRVNIGRALVCEPEILLLDEPFSDLDEVTREKLIWEIKEILSVNKITTIFVTHDRNETLVFSDKIAFLDEGKFIQQGTPLEVFNFPLNEKVAAFTGIETILSGEVLEVRDTLAIVMVSDKYIIKGSAKDIYKGDKVRICIRPENVVIAIEDRISSFRNSFSGVIKKINLFGIYYKIEINCGFQILSFVTKQAIEELELKEGKDIKVYFKASSVHLIK